MPTGADVSLPLLLPGIALLAAGLAVVVRALLGRRTGGTPHCGACDYVLLGNASGRCPECGATLNAPASVVYGNRVRQGRIALAGVAFVISSVPLLMEGGGFRVLRDVDLYQYKPTGWVIDDLRSPSSSAPTRAWAELQRRTQAKGLAALHNARLAEVALAEQGASTVGPVTSALVHHLGVAAVDGSLSDAQREVFFWQAVRLELYVPPAVIAGDPIPYQIRFESRIPTGAAGWRVVVRHTGPMLDGDPPARPGGVRNISGVGAAKCIAGEFAAVAPARAGRRDVSATVRVEILYAPRVAPPGHPETLLDSRDVCLTAPIEVLPPNSSTTRGSSVK